MPISTIPDISEDFLIRVAKGDVPGHSLVHKFGRAPTSTINVEQSVSELGTMQFPSTAVAMRVKAGGDATDTAAGVAAREVTIYGLDETGALAEEAEATAGISASTATTTTFIRVFRARVTSSGAYAVTSIATTGTNADDITIEDSGGAADYIVIPQYEGTSEYAGYTIPLGKTGYLLSALIQVDATKSADVILYQRPNILDTSVPVSSRRVMFYFDGVAGDTPFKPKSPIAIPALTDVWWNFIPSANGTECSIDFEILLVDD